MDGISLYDIGSDNDEATSNSFDENNASIEKMSEISGEGANEVPSGLIAVPNTNTSIMSRKVGEDRTDDEAQSPTTSTERTKRSDGDSKDVSGTEYKSRDTTRRTRDGRSRSNTPSERSRGRRNRSRSTSKSRASKRDRSSSRSKRRHSHRSRSRSPARKRRSHRSGSRDRHRHDSRGHERHRRSSSRDRKRDSRKSPNRDKRRNRDYHKARRFSPVKDNRDKKEEASPKTSEEASATTSGATVPKNLVTSQMAVNQALAEAAARAEQLTGIALPSYYNPAAVNPLKYAEQQQKRRLLWGAKKEATVDPIPSNNKWEAASFKDSDGKTTAKFRKLMGIKEEVANAVADKAADMDEELKRKQEELYRNLDEQYEVARMSTHTHRGIGLGFGHVSAAHTMFPK